MAIDVVLIALSYCHHNILVLYTSTLPDSTLFSHFSTQYVQHFVQKIEAIEDKGDDQRVLMVIGYVIEKVAHKERTKSASIVAKTSGALAERTVALCLNQGRFALGYYNYSLWTVKAIGLKQPNLKGLPHLHRRRQTNLLKRYNQFEQRSFC